MKKIIIVFLSLQYFLHAFYSETSVEECFSLVKENNESKKICNDLEKQIELYPRGESLKYNTNGHLNTTYIVLSGAGIDINQSHEIAFCSELPDDRKEFDAIYASIEELKNDKNDIYNRDLMEIIHSLHGGNQEAVYKRREQLFRIIKDGYINKTLTNCQLGIVIHAYADSYSHTYNKKLHWWNFFSKKEEQAYGGNIGHLLHGVKPDIIAFYPNKFKKYVKKLYSIFRKNRKNNTEIKKFFTLIDKLKKHRQSAIFNMIGLAKEKGKFNAYWIADKTADEMENFSKKRFYSREEIQFARDKYLKSFGEEEMKELIEILKKELKI